MEVNPNFTEKAKRDYVLVQRALNHCDQKAYADLMHYYRDSIFFLLLKMTNNKDDADDLTIEAFGKAFRNLKQYTPDYAFSTWLFKIASNNCIDFIRKKNQYTISLDSEFNEESGTEISNFISDDNPDPEEGMIQDQKISIMREVVDRLKPHYRILIEMRYFKEYSYEEIAEELNLPLGTVKAKLFRARDLLFQIIDKSKDSI